MAGDPGDTGGAACRGDDQALRPAAVASPWWRYGGSHSCSNAGPPWLVACGTDAGVGTMPPARDPLGSYKPSAFRMPAPKRDRLVGSVPCAVALPRSSV